MWRVTLPNDTSGGWVFGTRERAEAWCEQFGNTFNIEEDAEPLVALITEHYRIIEGGET